MNVRLATGPVSWGVDFADAPGNPAPDRVLDEIGRSGFRWTELGPLGYFPQEPAALAAALSARGLRLGGSGIFEPLHDPARLDGVLDVARRTSRAVAGVGGRYLVLIDVVSDERAKTTGRADAAPRLDGAGWAHLRDALARCAEIARSEGLRPVLHSHAGSYIEFEDEVQRVLEAFGPDELNLCLDTGHMAIAGVDPVEFYAAHADRVEYFHFKDVEPATLAAVVAERLDFWEAVNRGVFCPLGEGGVDFPRLAGLLRERDFDGWATVEQDCNPGPGADPLGGCAASLTFLAGIGLDGRETPGGG